MLQSRAEGRRGDGTGEERGFSMSSNLREWSCPLNRLMPTHLVLSYILSSCVAVCVCDCWMCACVCVALCSICCSFVKIIWWEFSWAAQGHSWDTGGDMKREGGWSEHCPLEADMRNYQENYRDGTEISKKSKQTQ